MNCETSKYVVEFDQRRVKIEMKYYEKTLYEDSKCLITRDKYNFIIRSKPIDQKHPFRNATYIAYAKRYLIWELTKGRKLYSENSSEVQSILELLKRQGEALECPSAT